MQWIILILGILANASASVLVKLAMSPPRSFPKFQTILKDPLTVVQNWPFWLGLFLYGLAFLLYAAALARLPLNVAHPILTAGAIATVAVFSALLFKETFYWTTIVGLFLIIAGVTLVTIKV